MPLRVHCPSGCLIHMSINRVGRIVRCPQCKTAIRIPVIPESEMASGKPVSCQAKIANRRSGLEKGSAPVPSESATARNAQSLPAVEPTMLEDSEVERAGMAAMADHPRTPGVGGNHPIPKKPRLAVPDLVKPVIHRRRRPLPVPESASTPAARTRVHPVPEFENDESRELSDEEIAAPHNDSSPNGLINPEPELDRLAVAPEEIRRFDQSVEPGDFKNADRDVARSSRVQREMFKSANPKSATKEPVIDCGAEPGNADPSMPPNPEIIPPGESEPEPAVANSFGSNLDAAEHKNSRTDRVVPGSKPGDDGFVDKFDFLPRPSRAKLPAAMPVVSFREPIPPAFVAQEERNWEERLERANCDRKVLARFFAFCLCFVAVVNVVPALYHGYHWAQLAESMALPRWIYIQIFVGAIHLVYAIFLFQINDWSAMRSVSVAMLVVAFVFGFISTGLLVGGGKGNLTGFLGIPYTLNRQACIWCVAMLCLATLMSYWGGRESNNWQRAEYLLKDIMSKSAAQA